MGELRKRPSLARARELLASFALSPKLLFPYNLVVLGLHDSMFARTGSAQLDGEIRRDCQNWSSNA